MKKAHIITVGNELLIGDTVNTNATWIGRFLTECGFSVERVHTIPDQYDLLADTMRLSLQEANFTVVTGGLGPTHDDITKKVAADIFESEMVQNEKVLNYIEEIFEKRGYTLSQSNIDQALVPEKCEVLFNKQGTAPGMWLTKNNNHIAILPGVPYEMKYLMEQQVKPKIFETFKNQQVRVTEYFKTAGVPESTLSEHVGNLDEYTQNGIEIAYLPNPGGVTIRISTYAKDREAAQKKLYKISEWVHQRAADFIFGKGKDVRLAEVLGEILTKQNLTIAVAESCTGGLLSNSITDISGCSKYYNGSVIAYSNHVKVDMLGVSEKTITKIGAVSKQTALQMAKGVAELTGSDIGVSTTGIAGPDGGTQDKPVGTIWMGFWIKGEQFALQSLFTNNRLVNKERSVMVVLETLRRKLLGIEQLPYQLKPETA